MTSKLSKTVLAALALLAAPVAAQAADLSYKGPPPAPVAYYNWTGFYAGINGGYASGTSNWTALPINNEPSGGLIGATLGYNFQAGALVYGLEGDWAWSTVDNSTVCGLGACESKQSWFGTARGRIGYAFDRLMPYLTGGAAFANLKAGITPGFGTVSSTEIGWTAGVGF